jgi:hypothetical protein
VPGAASESSTENIAMAETLFMAARGLMEAGRYPEACTKLAESYRLDAASGTLLNLAVCHEHEGKLASAWGEFRQALHEAESAGRADREQLARSHAAALEPQLPFLAFDVLEAARVPELSIVRNGVTVSAAAWSTELPVDPGRVLVVQRAPGYLPSTQEVVIAPGQHLTITVHPLEPMPVAAAPATSRTRRRATGLGLLIGGVLTMSVGAVAGTLALHQRSESDAACPALDGELRCTSAGASAMSSARSWALVSDLTIGLGALAAGVGTFLFFTGRSQVDPSSVAHGRARRAPEPTWSWRLSGLPYGARGTLAHSF